MIKIEAIVRPERINVVTAHLRKSAAGASTTRT